MNKIVEGFKKCIRVVVKGAIYIWVKLYNRAEVRGKENIPKEGALIFCGNHKSYLDGPLIQATAGKKNIYFMVKAELYKNPFLHFLGWAFGTIPVSRDEKDLESIKQALKVIKRGDWFGIFPEGTRNGLAKGEAVKDGAAFFAIRTGAKVIPCGIKGGVKGNRKAIITYGKPLDFSQYKGKKDKETLELVTKEIMDNIIELTK